MVINMRRAALFLPVYVVLMLSTDAFFKKAGLNAKGDLPLWLIVAFTITALSVFLIVAWFVTQKARGKIPVKRERVYMGFLVALIVSGFVDDGLRGLAWIFFHSKSIWIMIPMYILSYVALLAVLVFTLNKVAAKSDDAPPNNSAVD